MCEIILSSEEKILKTKTIIKLVALSDASYGENGAPVVPGSSLVCGRRTRKHGEFDSALFIRFKEA